MTSNETILKAINDGNVEKAKGYLECNIREGAAKKAGAKSKDVTIIKRVMKDAEKWVSDERATKAQPCTFFGKDYYCFLEGHRILADTNDFGYEHADDPYKVRPIMQDIENYKDLCRIEIDRKKLAERKALSKADKWHHVPYIIETENGDIGINPDFLMDMLDFVGTDCVYVYKDKTFNKKGVYAVNEENGRLGLTLPVNLPASTAYEVDQVA